MPQQWFSAPVTNLAALVAASAKFRSETGAANAAAALAYIDDYQDSNRNVSDGMFAIVGSNGGRSRRKQAAGSYLNSGGSLFVVFVRPTPEAHENDPSAAGKEFAGVIESILDEMEAVAGTDTYLNVTGWTENEPVTEGDHRREGGQRFWGCEIGVEVE